LATTQKVGKKVSAIGKWLKLSPYAPIEVTQWFKKITISGAECGLKPRFPHLATTLFFRSRQEFLDPILYFRSSSSILAVFA
jgi:hypothetical protein